MRVAQVAPLAESVPPKLYGGTERCVHWITEELVALGHDITLFASGDSKTNAKLIPCSEKGMRLMGYHDLSASTIVMIDKILSQRDQFDIIHFHIDILHYPFFASHPNKTLTTLHGRLDLKDYLPAYQHYCNMPLVAISAHQKSTLACQANWAGIVHHGIPKDMYTCVAHSKGEYLAFLGRISPEKRPDLAITIATACGIPIKIAAKVDQADEQYWNTVISPMLDHPLVEYIGEINDTQKQDFLGNAKALLFPIDWPEPFGLVLIESMAVGTPVIAFKRGSVPEILKDGVSGYIVNTLEEAISACHNLNRLDRKKVRQEFENKFSSRIMAERYISIYQELVKKA